ncbi:transposase, partial [uncultured Microscilla sp.]|uniref:transposase n=1 Tax=uncultured Microscilla sp. TaxID=432653 RepID=UPI002636FC52
MLELTFLEGLQPYLQVNIAILHEVIQSIYCVSSGGITMKNLSRWTSSKGSYRNIQRLYGSQIDWLCLNIYLITSCYFGYEFSGDYLLAVDETVEGKSRKKTWGISSFYSSIVGKPIRSVSFHAISLVEVVTGKSFMLEVSQN